MDVDRLPVEIEVEPGKWVEFTVTFSERRTLLAAVRPERRFVDKTGKLFIAHELNLWCVVVGSPPANLLRWVELQDRRDAEENNG